MLLKCVCWCVCVWRGYDNIFKDSKLWGLDFSAIQAAVARSCQYGMQK